MTAGRGAARRASRWLSAICVAVLVAGCGAQAGDTSSPSAASSAPSATASAGGTASQSTSGRSTLAPSGRTTTATVVRVVDGDTIHVSVGGRDYRVRYIGIDAPEIEPTVQRMGLEASAENAKLVAGKTVVLERDVSETDRYGRLLRYIWIRQGSGWLFVNRELVRLGFAASTAYPPDVKYQSVFDAAQRQAQAAKLGLWAAAPLPFAGGSAKANCDAAYPTVCIPPPPPDLDCSDITFRRFKVLPPDPHHFDSDHDGIGCESG